MHTYNLRTAYAALAFRFAVWAFWLFRGWIFTFPTDTFESIVYAEKMRRAYAANRSPFVMWTFFVLVFFFDNCRHYTTIATIRTTVPVSAPKMCRAYAAVVFLLMMLTLFADVFCFDNCRHYTRAMNHRTNNAKR